MTTDFLPLISVLVIGWLLAATLGTWAYFANQQKTESK